METIRTKRSITLNACWISILWISIFLLSTAANAGLEDGLIAHYPFDGSPVDVGPNSYDGSLYGTTDPCIDRTGNPDSAYAFKYPGDYIDTDRFQLPQTFSLSMWIDPNNVVSQQWFLAKRSGGKSLITIGFADDGYDTNGYAVDIGGMVYSAGSVTAGWQHIAVVVEKSAPLYCKARFYKNGRLLWTKNLFDFYEDADIAPVSIGSFNRFPGAIDDVRIYSRALSSTEIELLHDPTLGLDVVSDGDIDGKDLGFFSENMGNIHWYKDADRDLYSDGTSVWGANPPDKTYYPKEKLLAVSGDCDDNDAGVFPDGSGRGCRPYGACCYLAQDDCPPTYHCDEDVGQRVCENELGGTFYEGAPCRSLIPNQCPVGSEVGACCTVPTSGNGVCNDGVLSFDCDGDDQDFYGGRTCSDLSHEECPQAAATGACCHPKISYVNESGVFPVQCLSGLTEYKCTLLQGVWSEGQTCEDLSDTDCAPYGGCCYHDTSSDTDQCANWMLEENCNQLSGSFHKNEKCADLTNVEGCPGIPVTSACCISENIPNAAIRCVDSRTEAQCVSIGGTWYTPEADGTPVYCRDLTTEQCPMVVETTGACCINVASGSTTTATCHDDVTISGCTDAGGTFFASRQCSDLSEAECPVPDTGACCHPKISYVNESGVFPVQCLDSQTAYKCKILQGVWTTGTDCDDLTDCPPYGGCCYHDTATNTDKCANWMLETDCSKLNGSFHENQKCADLTEEAGCPGVPVDSACCLTGDGSTITAPPIRCIDRRTEIQCNSLGGTWFPPEEPPEGEDPVPVYCYELDFEQCPMVPEDTGACCVTLSSGGTTTATCNDNVTISDCADAGGTFFSERQCADLSSEECPVPAATGSCCHPKISYVNESGVFPVQCLDSLTQYKCKILQGTWTESTNCDDLTDCPPYGGCCYHDAATNTDKCANWMLEADCNKLGGSFHANEKCDAIGCVEPPRVSACCLTTSSEFTTPIRCIDCRTEIQCTTLGGTWYEPPEGTYAIYCSELTDEQCPQLSGACCRTIVDDNGDTTTTCTDSMTSPDCSDAGGTFFASRQCSDLSPEECPLTAATGSCCHPKISYVNESGVFPVQCLDGRTEYQCNILQGTWSAYQDCDQLTDCPPYGGCCYQDADTGEDKCANWMLAETCSQLNGTFHANKKCDAIGCVDPPRVSACCLSTSSEITAPIRCIDCRTEIQCNSLGGTWYEPPEGTYAIYCHELSPEQCPQITGACCETGTGSPAVCNDNVTSTACSGEDKNFYANRLCADLTPEECPVPEPRGACCHPNASTSDGTPVRCIDSRTAYQCGILQGTWTEGTYCADLEDCPPYGGCCYQDADTGVDTCANWMLQADCDQLNGTFHADETCGDIACIRRSACCLSNSPDATSYDYRCFDQRTETQCNAIGGTWYEPPEGGTSVISCSELSEEECPSVATGACCIQTGSTAYCADHVTGSDCADNSGTFFSTRQCSDLTPEECPVQATGTCCHPKISYVNEDGVFPVQCLDNLTEYKCSLIQGQWREDGTCADLSDAECAPYGACCYEDANGIAQCSDGIFGIACAKMGGIFSVNKQCSDISCGEILTPGACCLSGTGSAQQCMDDTNVVACEALGGEFFSDTSCRYVTYNELCAPIGACCYSTRAGYACASYKTEAQCSRMALLGEYTFSEDLTCQELPESSPCYIPDGVCCLPRNGGCLTSSTPEQCAEAQGTWKPGGTCPLSCLFQ